MYTSIRCTQRIVRVYMHMIQPLINEQKNNKNIIVRTSQEMVEHGRRNWMCCARLLFAASVARLFRLGFTLWQPIQINIDETHDSNQCKYWTRWIRSISSHHIWYDYGIVFDVCCYDMTHELCAQFTVPFRFTQYGRFEWGKPKNSVKSLHNIIMCVRSSRLIMKATLSKSLSVLLLAINIWMLHVCDYIFYSIDFLFSLTVFFVYHFTYEWVFFVRHSPNTI